MASTKTVPAPTLAGKLAGLIGRRLAVRTAHRLKAQGNGVAAQEATRMALVATLAPTAFGRQHGLESGLPYDRFRVRVEPRTYEGFAPFIERMKQGEPDVLHPGRCTHFAVSSGTTAGPSKWLPVNAAMLEHFRQTGLDSLFFYALRTGRGSVFSGKHLFLGGSTGLVAVPGVTPPIYSGDLSGITALNLPWWAERQLYEPGREIARLENWPQKIEAMAERTWNRDITLVAGIPSWLLVLAARVARLGADRTGREIRSLRDLWPNLECLIHGGVPVTPFAEELRRAFGADVRLHEVYPASEGFIAAQDAEEGAGLRLLADHGIFYEFIPLHDYDDANPVASAARAVPLAGVRTGVDYVLLLTTPAGLVRYVIGDVVRFVSVEPPRLVYVGRTKLQLSAFGEHVIEKELTDTLTQVCRAQSVQVENFHVAPLFPTSGTRDIGRHEWWIELRGGVAPTAEYFAAALDRSLAALNDDYAAKRSGRGLDLPLVRFVPAGTFERWLKSAGKWGGQHKTPRCRSDRQIAVELARAATIRE